MALNRRSLLGLFAAAPAAAVAAKLPAAPVKPAPMVLRTTVAAHEVYGRSPAMDALPEMKRYAEAMRRMLEITKDMNPIDYIDMDAVKQEIERCS